MQRSRLLALTQDQQTLLEKWSRGGSTPYRLVKRSQIVLLAARGDSNRAIAQRLRLNPITVARWRSRFLLLGVEGIRHDAPRLGSPPPVPRELVQRILHKTLFERPSATSRWSTRTLGRAVGVSHSTVRRIWGAHGIHPPRSRVGALAQDSRFHPKSIDVVGVYVNPPQRAMALSLRDADQSKALARGGPSSRAASSGRSWMVDLVTTLNLLDQPDLKGSAHRLLDQEFLSFLHSIHELRQATERIELLAESAGPVPPASLARWVRRHPEFSARVEVGSASLRQIVVEWFGDPSACHPADQPPASLPGLRTAVEEWSRETNKEPRPFAWTRK
jgi:transposase